MSSRMGYYGPPSSSYSDPWGSSQMNNSQQPSSFGYSNQGNPPFPQTLPARQNQMFSQVPNQRHTAQPLQTSSSASYFTPRGHQGSNQQDLSMRSPSNHMNSRPSLLHSASPAHGGSSQQHPPPPPHSGRSISMSRFELSAAQPSYNEGNFCDDMMEQRNPDHARRFGSFKPYVGQTDSPGPSQPRSSLARRPSQLDESLERIPLPPAAHHHSEEKQRFQFPTHEVRPLMPSRSSLHDAGDVEMDGFIPSEPQNAAIPRPPRRSEGIPKFQFPTHDVRPQITPRRMEPDVLDMDDYGLREPQSSFRKSVHMDDSLSPSVHRRVEGKQGFQFPSYDMRSPSTGRLRRSDQYDNSDMDMMNGFGVERPGSSIHDVAPQDYGVYRQRQEDRSRYQGGYEAETFLTPRPVRESGMVQMGDQGFYRPLPASSIRQSKVERRSSLHEDSGQMGMVPPLTLSTALPRRSRDKLPLGESSSMLYSDRAERERRTLPLYFLRKKEREKKTEQKAARLQSKRKPNRKKGPPRNKNKIRMRRNLYCVVCERKFDNKEALNKHFDLDSHKKNLMLFRETLANIKKSEGDDAEFDDETVFVEERFGGKDIKIYCGICKETFRNKSLYAEHLAFRRHKLNARINQLFKDAKGDRDHLSPDDPLGSFCHYINSDTQTILIGEKEERNVTLVKSKENIFCLKFLDLRHMLCEEPGPAGEEYLEEVDGLTPSKDKRPYRCSLCNENITGVDNTEMHLYSVSHQEAFKANVNPNWEIQIPIESSSYFDVVLDLWRVCKDKYKKELRNIEKFKETSSCICGYKIQRFVDYRNHFPKAFAQGTLPPVDSEDYPVAEDKRTILNYRITYRECVNLIKLFSLPHDVVVAKRTKAMELVGDTTDQTAAASAAADTATTEATTAASAAAAAPADTTTDTSTPSVKMDESVKEDEEQAVSAMKQETSN
ncbi:unnamed protein product [Trichobilharzia szidati]|nr:unnamed protein product [Trichobilharzia szidati]